jgi:hypothetical protein
MQAGSPARKTPVQRHDRIIVEQTSSLKWQLFLSTGETLAPVLLEYLVEDSLYILHHGQRKKVAVERIQRLRRLKPSYEWQGALAGAAADFGVGWWLGKGVYPVLEPIDRSKSVPGGIILGALIGAAIRSNVGKEVYDFTRFEGYDARERKRDLLRQLLAINQIPTK